MNAICLPMKLRFLELNLNEKVQTPPQQAMLLETKTVTSRKYT